MWESPWVSVSFRPPTSRSAFAENYCTSTEHPHFYKHRYRQFIWYFYFLLPLWDQRPSIEDQDIWEDLQNISWHAISYHSDGRANEERMPVHDYGSLHQNPSCQYEPCVPLSRNSLTWTHLNELHAWRMVVFHMAEWPIDILSLIFLVVKALTFRPHFNGCHVLISDSLRMQLPGPSACLVWWPQHCLSPFIWVQVSLISHLNCIIAKIFIWIKLNSALIMPLFAHRLLTFYCLFNWITGC